MQTTSQLLLAMMVATITLSCSRQSSEVLYLEKDKKPVAQFLLSNSLHESQLEINNQRKDLRAELICDGKVSFRKNRLWAREISGVKIAFELAHETSGTLIFSTAVNKCSLKIADQVIQLVKDEEAYSFLKMFHRVQEACPYQIDPLEENSLKGLFLTDHYPMMTCAHPAPAIEILAESEQGLLAKMEALLGYRPAANFIWNQNPYAELDFTHAPQLDAIFVSTLLYRHDFTGTVIARLLKFHADRGTLVNIIGTGYMHSQEDKKLLKDLSQARGNLRVQEYKYTDPRGGLKPPMRYLDNYLRDMHVKMFVTISLTNPQDNVVITGGRNIHDGFVFKTKPDLSKYPELDQPGEGDYAYWNDLEIKITSQELAHSVYAHLLRLWNRQHEGEVTTPILATTPTTAKISGSDILNSSTTMMRHFLSLPFNDDHALEKLYVEMIDKAKVSIKLSSPYLRPTRPIMKAIQRAIDRKVDITIQTRIDLKGDTQAWLYEETNKTAINSLYDKVKIYEWTEGSILHTKMLLIDGEFAFFGSVNVSRRSFIQDVESGFIIHDPLFVQKLTTIFTGYNQRSRIIDQDQKRHFFAGIVVNLLQDQF